MVRGTIDFAEEQVAQQQHDLQNHLDILSLHKMERLKHYGLHFAKYVGRFARGPAEPKSSEQTYIDALLVCLSAANTLNQPLAEAVGAKGSLVATNDFFVRFADASGRFADACEKLDHLEEFRPLATAAIRDIAASLLDAAAAASVDIPAGLSARRRQLHNRQVYHRKI